MLLLPGQAVSKLYTRGFAIHGFLSGGEVSSNSAFLSETHDELQRFSNTGQGRLGTRDASQFVRPGSTGVPFPIELSTTARIVALVAGGW
jgi:hypothetical protein